MAGLELNKKRKAKTSLTQYELYINMLESNPYFRENKITPDRPNEVAECWEKLVTSLNSSGGPQKTLTEWKRVFVDWKCQVRKRARIIRNSFKGTGNTGVPEKELTEMEKKLLYLTGEIVLDGMIGIPELGINNEKNIEEAMEQETTEDKEIQQRTEGVIVTKKIHNANILSTINSNLGKLVELKKQEIDLKTEEIKIKKLKLGLK